MLTRWFLLSDRLKELDWMIGDWLDEGSDSEVRVQCKRSEDGNFLDPFVLDRAGRQAGHDTSLSESGGTRSPASSAPGSSTPRADSARGNGADAGDGGWSSIPGPGRKGTTASATNSMVRVRPDQIRWASTDRVIGDESIPGEESHVLVRVPPAPRSVPTRHHSWHTRNPR